MYHPDLISNFTAGYRRRMANETELEIKSMRVPVCRPLALSNLSSCWGYIVRFMLAILRPPALIYIARPRMEVTGRGYNAVSAKRYRFWRSVKER